MKSRRFSPKIGDLPSLQLGGGEYTWGLFGSSSKFYNWLQTFKTKFFDTVLKTCVGSWVGSRVEHGTEPSGLASYKFCVVLCMVLFVQLHTVIERKNEEAENDSCTPSV